ncbi:MAG: Trk system potassium transporter TrkA [Acidobacteria bacterium]|nr:Trk system potassium transporter TrkA [Acidobacteriota bacterium]
MRIFIVGAGEVGIHIASSLVLEGHDLVIIERDAKKAADLQSSMDLLAVHGDGCNPRLLKKHGIDSADLLFAVSDNDATNILASLTARSLGAKQAVVRIGNPDMGKNPLVRRDDGITPLYPERLVAEEIVGLTKVPGAGRARSFGDGKLVLLQARPSISAPIYGRRLKEIAGPPGWILAGIHRTSGTVIPRGDTKLRPGDLLYAIGPSETSADYLSSIGLESETVEYVVIAGAGHVGTALARMLIKEKIRVTVIQRGHERAFDFAAKVPEALVLEGNATDSEMLAEAGVAGADYFVAATQDDENNLLASLLAREAGARVVVALYHRPEFLNLMKAVQIDVPLSPRMMIAGTILRMVHRQEILSMDLVEGDAEIVEFKVPARARVLKRPLAGLRFPRAAIVGAVVRGDQNFVPKGDFQFKEGDRALVFTLAEALPELERLFRGR